MICERRANAERNASVPLAPSPDPSPIPLKTYYNSIRTYFNITT